MFKKSILLGLLLLSVLIPAAFAGSIHQQPPVPATADGVSAEPLPVNRLIIQFEETAVSQFLTPDQADGVLTALSAAAGVELTYARPMSGDAHVLNLPAQMPAADAAAIASKLAAQPGVVYAEPDYIMQIDANPSAPLLTPNDTLFGNQWHYIYQPGTSEGLNLLPAWNINTGSSSVVVAVLDTGILNHADLAGQTVPGYDFITSTAVSNDGNGRDANPADPGDWVTANQCYSGSSARNSSWHGTHVAGTIAAKSNNNLGVAGVSWNSKILPVRVLGMCGGATSDIADGVRWAAGLSVSGVPNNSNPAQVINMSLGGAGSCNTTFQNAITAAYNAGASVVVSAGNSAANAGGYAPANCNNVITVASNDRSGDLAYYSNYGATIEVTAPGGETSITSNGVLSTLDGGTTTPNNDNQYAYYQGTSMAAPHVAGLIALILSEAPSYTPAQVLTLLQATARNFPAGSSCNTSNCGTGIVDAYAALSNISTTPPNSFIYMPIILNSYPQALANADFEQGHTGWTEYSLNGFDIIYSAGSLPIAPRSGSWAAWLAGSDNEVSYVQQSVYISPSKPYLAYWHWISSSQSSCGGDLGGVVINGSTVVDVYNLCASTNTGGWSKHVVNLSAYAGQTVMLRIEADTDSAINSNLFVDDVSFQSTATAVLTPQSTSSDPATAIGK